jgi:hypothetical protein
MYKKTAVLIIAMVIAAGFGAIAKSQIPGTGAGMNKPRNMAKGIKNPPCAELNAGAGLDFLRTIRRPNLAQDLGITPEQGKEIIGKLDASKTKLNDATDNVCRIGDDLKNAMLAENPDHTDIYRLIDDLTFARQELMKIMADLQFDILEVLTPDQWAALRKMASEPPKRNKNGKSGMKNKM